MKNFPPLPYPAYLNNGIRLDALQVKDAELFFEFVEKNKTHLELFDPFYREFQSVDDARKILTRIQSLREEGKSLTCAIWDDAQLIGYMNGGIGDHNDIRIGYAIAAKYQGKGIVTQTGNILLRHAFDTLNIRYAWLTCWVTNTRSIHVAERLGFKADTRLLPADPQKGILSEQYRYILLNPRLFG